MANRFPLIVNTATGNSVQELPSGDFLDLSDSGIANSGNITVNASSYFFGNGSQLTGIVSSYGNANVVANLAALGSNPVTTTANITGGNILTSGLISATGNITGGNILGGANVNATTHTGTTVSVSGAITGGAITGSSLTVSTGNINGGNINNNNTTGVGNIGNATVAFNTVFAKATSAQYADLAERYVSDAEYAPGTVLEFGGKYEVTISNEPNSPRIAGVVSTNPAHVMNADQAGEHTVVVALTGRVPTSVIGTIRKGDMMVSAGNGYAVSSAAPAVGTVIGKSLENFDGESGVIEIVVGRL